MRVKYRASKGYRTKRRRYIGLEIQSIPSGNWWYVEDYGRWVDVCQVDAKTLPSFSNMFHAKGRSLKAYLRAARRFAAYLPKGTVLEIFGLFRGQCVYVTL